MQNLAAEKRIAVFRQSLKVHMDNVCSLLREYQA